MKLLRYGPQGQEKPGLIDPSGTLRDLSAHSADIGPAALSPAGLARLAAVAPDSLPAVKGTPRFGVPFTGTRKFVAIGLNYADHAAESNMAIPTEPVVFSKFLSCLQGPDDDVMMPPGCVTLDWEVELGVVIGTEAQRVSEAEALEYVAGYCVVNDVSDRDWQFNRGGSWDKGKGFDTFGPVGPWLVTKDELPNPQDLGLWLDVNGTRMQTGSTRTMIFTVAYLVSYCSNLMTLEPGDIITTGTPPGVGFGKKPPVYLGVGDVMRLGVDGLGVQQQRVVEWKRGRP